MSTKYRVVPVEPIGEITYLGEDFARVGLYWAEGLKLGDELYLALPVPSACCVETDEEKALLASGDHTPEELYGVGGKPSCPKCHKGSMPPAGDVEVLDSVAYVNQCNGQFLLKRTIDKDNFAEFWDGLVLAKDHRAHVTRIQAQVSGWQAMAKVAMDGKDRLRHERDALQSDLNSLRKELADTGSDVETIAEHNIELQFELTKARELLVRCQPRLSHCSLLDDVREFLARQSTPAAKDAQS